MPKVIKKKPVKRKPVKEAEVKSSALQAIEALKSRQKQVAIGVSAIVAVVALLIIISLYSSSQQKKASYLAAEAASYYYSEVVDDSLTEEDKWKKAVELYQESVDTKATPGALFYLGNSYFNLGDYENAAKQYIQFESKFKGETAILPLVYQKLASAYLRMNNSDMALSTLQKLARIEKGIFKDTALVYEARHYEAAGDPETSLEKYREVILEFPDSPWAAEANAKISASEAEQASADTEKNGVQYEKVEGEEKKAQEGAPTEQAETGQQSPQESKPEEGAEK